jgi:glucosyl-dolichyl phosphate glucuronosyltransferase
MTITVILCTYNRAESLSKALASVAGSVMPEEVKWEVLVVDNNSKDQTRAVVQDYCNRRPENFRYLFEPTPGKSNALNAGIRRASGEVLAFMDDDVIVDAEWLQKLTAPLRNGSWVGVGGRILPNWTSPQPIWLPRGDRYAFAPLAMFDLGPNPGQLQEAPFGTNMAFRKTVFEQFGDFRTDLGPRPGSEIRDEDTEFGQRLLNAGQRLYYEPSAIVHHEVSEDRLRKQYFLNWWFDKARAEIRQSGISTDTRWFVAGVPLYLFRRLAVWTLRWLATLDPSKRFSCKLKLWGVAGAIRECYHTSIGAGKRAAAVTSKTD